MREMIRPQDLLLVLKLQALSDEWDRANVGYGGGGGSGAGFGDGTGFGGPDDEGVNSRIGIKNGPPVSFSELGASIGVSASQAYSAAKRAIEAELLREDYSVRRKPLLDSLLAIRYYLPAKRDSMVRGIPTAFAAPPLREYFSLGGEPEPVWPHGAGTTRGLGCEPIYKTAPEAALKDSRLYEYLALVDTLRIGRAREIGMARAELETRLGTRE